MDNRSIKVIFLVLLFCTIRDVSAVPHIGDNFESYTDNAALAAKWDMVYWGGNNEVDPSEISMSRSLSISEGLDGSKGMLMEITVEAGVSPSENLGANWEPCIYGITGYYTDINERTDLTNYLGIRLWIKPGTVIGDKAYFKLNLIESSVIGEEKWMSPKVGLDTLDVNGQYIFFGFNDFYEYFTGSGEPMDRTSIKISFLFLAYDDTTSQSSSTTIWVDDIQLVSNIASAPSPDNRAVIIGLTPTLSWTAGVDANAHDVYFGADKNAVTNTDISDLTGIYRGRQNLDVNSYNPCCLEQGTTYYWRIDEVNDTNIWQGEVWSFTVWGPAEIYSNPVISAIGPADPTVIFYQGKYYMYPTGDNTSYHVYTSYNLVNWTKGSRVFIPGGINVWAPDVFYNSTDEKFYLYYTANWKIGVAVANKPDEVFVDKGILIYNAIDAHMFQDDDGKLYLYHVRRSNNGLTIFAQEITNLLELTGNSKMIIEPTEAWERISGNVTEGPWMMKREGIYYLLYSGTGANTPNYAIGYATANNPLGPFTKYTGNPIIERGNGVFGPGHGSVIKDAAGELWHVYHQKEGTNIDWRRFICIDPFWFDSNGVLYGKATRGTSEPAPVVASLFADDFENYDTDSTLALTWGRVFWSGNDEDSSTQVTMTRTLDRVEGANESKAMKLVFTFDEGVTPSMDTAAANWDPAIFGITGTTINVLASKDLTDYVGIRLWLKSGEMIGDNVYFKMNMVESDGEKWMSPKINLSSLNPIGEEVYLSFDDFEEYFTGSGQSMDRTNTVTFYLWLAYDDTATANSSTTVWVDNITLDSIVVSVDQDFSVLPEKFALWQNYPNPFNPVTTIRYNLPETGNVQLVIYDILGREVMQLVNERLNGGYHSVQWNGRDNYGVEASAGVYIYRLSTRDFAQTKKLVLLK